MRMKVLMMLLGLLNFMMYLELLNYIVASVTSEKSEAATSHPSTSPSGPKRKSKIRLLTDEESDWLKCNLSYTRLPPKGSDFQIKRKELKTRLPSLSPKDIFEELVTDIICYRIVKETVRYAVSVKNEQDFVQPFESRARC
jgi:hypothetical protein